MRQFYRALTVMAFATGLCSAQSLRWYGTTGDTSLSGTALMATVQQPSSLAKTVSFETATVYCSVACDVAQSQWTSSAATATSVALVAITNSIGTPVTTFWAPSNAGAGQAVAPLLHVPAGGTIVIDLSNVSLPNTSSTGVNYSVTVQAITGVANITIIGSER